MVVADLLSMLGLGGSVALVATSLIALYHGRSLLLLAGRAATWLRVVGVLAFFSVLALGGFVPGVELSVDFGTLGAAVSAAVGWLWTLLAEVLPLL